jgi:hypothetical protein
MMIAENLLMNVEGQSVVVERPYAETRSLILGNSCTASQRYPPQAMHIFQALWQERPKANDWLLEAVCELRNIEILDVFSRYLMICFGGLSLAIDANFIRRGDSSSGVQFA